MVQKIGDSVLVNAISEQEERTFSEKLAQYHLAVSLFDSLLKSGTITAEFHKKAVEYLAFKYCIDKSSIYR